MLGKLGLYINTISYLKPDQIFWRVGKKMGMKCALKAAHPSQGRGQRIAVSIPELDFDPAFVKRFCVGDLMQDRVCFLYEGENFNWDGIWHVDGRSPLWNFNLHYFEYIHPLVKRYLETGDRIVLDKTIQMIRGWICQNPQDRAGDGWSAYTISLRLINWMSYLAAVGDDLDASFRNEVDDSIYEQYIFLSTHLEKEILGNHYFENLKALVLCSIYFGDLQSLPAFLHAFRKECHEEILADGIHFELSPMYHKIVLEGLLRVAVALRAIQMPDKQMEKIVRDMVSATYSLECGVCRTPLFNDSGDNVSKSCKALVDCARRYLGIVPEYRSTFPDSGFYIFTTGPWKLIVDAGAAGPDYIPGHSHCDAMSFELYHDGKPFLVNCGTYAYQCVHRHWFRSTQAHNTVQIADVEQSEIWSIFRLARRSRTRVLEVSENGLQMEMMDYKGNLIQREILLKEDSLYIKDQARGLKLQSHLHSISEIEVTSDAKISRSEVMYAPEYGLLQTVHQITTTGNNELELIVVLP